VPVVVDFGVRSPAYPGTVVPAGSRKSAPGVLPGASARAVLARSPRHPLGEDGAALSCFQVCPLWPRPIFPADPANQNRMAAKRFRSAFGLRDASDSPARTPRSYEPAKSSALRRLCERSRSQMGCAPLPAHLCLRLSRYLIAAFRPFNEFSGASFRRPISHAQPRKLALQLVSPTAEHIPHVVAELQKGTTTDMRQDSLWPFQSHRKTSQTHAHSEGMMTFGPREHRARG